MPLDHTSTPGVFVCVGQALRMLQGQRVLLSEVDL